MNFQYRPKVLFMHKRDFIKKYLVDIGYLKRFIVAAALYAFVMPTFVWIVEEESFSNVITVVFVPLIFLMFIFILVQITLFISSLKDWDSEVSFMENKIIMRADSNFDLTYEDVISCKKRGTCVVLRYRRNLSYGQIYFAYPDKIPAEFTDLFVF